MSGRNPEPTSEVTTRVMRANKGKGTGPEMDVRRILREAGYPGYRLNWKGAPGHPDIAYPGRRVAIFVNGCFWHRCPKCDLQLPKSHTEFWREKFDRNVRRDREKTEALESMGWTVVTVWECELRDPDAVRDRLVEVLSGRRGSRRRRRAGSYRSARSSASCTSSRCRGTCP